MESKVPNTSVVLVKRCSSVHTQSLKVSCHPDFNCFWHTHLRALGGEGPNSSVWVKQEEPECCLLQLVQAECHGGSSWWRWQLLQMQERTSTQLLPPAAFALHWQHSCLSCWVLVWLSQPVSPGPQYGERPGCSQPLPLYYVSQEEKNLDGDRVLGVILL